MPNPTKKADQPKRPITRKKGEKNITKIIRFAFLSNSFLLFISFFCIVHIALLFLCREVVEKISWIHTF